MGNDIVGVLETRGSKDRHIKGAIILGTCNIYGLQSNALSRLERRLTIVINARIFSYYFGEGNSGSFSQMLPEGPENRVKKNESRERAVLGKLWKGEDYQLLRLRM